MSPEKRKEIALMNEALHYREELRKIAANTCCGTCREAALVAAAALEYPTQSKRDE